MGSASAVDTIRNISTWNLGVKPTTTSRLAPSYTAPSIQVDARLNRLVIQHCTPSQWEIISQIVKVLDVAAEDETLDRKQVVHRLRYRQAEDVAKALRDAYKDVMEERAKAAAPVPTGFSRGLAASSRSPA